MKLKNWLITFCITIMLIPILTGLFLYRAIEKYNNDIEIKNYITNISKFEKYDKVLQNPKLYIHPNKNYKLLEEKDKNKVEINLYDKDGLQIYSSMNTSTSIYQNKEILYSELYKIKHGYRADTLKKPIFKKNNIIGFYEITIARTKWINGVNNRTILAVTLFILVFLITLFLVIKLINKKVNKPLEFLINAMGKFASGKKVSIKHNVKDEIGELIKHFNNMKNEIENKRKEIGKQQKSKEYMIAAISHDLKTPLTSIRAYTELLKSQDSLNVTNTNKCTSVILNKCDYMKSMIDDLLMYTLLTTDYKMNFVEVDGQEFFEMLFSDYDKICEKKGIIFKSNISVKGFYKVDVKQMIRVIDNLISNALKYTKKGQSIHLAAYYSDVKLPNWIPSSFKQEIKSFKDKGVVFLVQNEGDKIPKEDIEKIFKPFYKVDTSKMKSPKSSTGLGLSVVKLIMDKHHGKIKILSEENKGTIIIGFLKDFK